MRERENARGLCLIRELSEFCSSERRQRKNEAEQRAWEKGFEPMTAVRALASVARGFSRGL